MERSASVWLVAADKLKEGTPLATEYFPSPRDAIVVVDTVWVRDLLIGFDIRSQ